MRRYSTALLTALLVSACLCIVPAGAQGERGRMIKRFALPSDPVPHGEVFELSLYDDTYDTAMAFLSEHQVTDVVGVEMLHLFIVYDDDTAWGDGTMFRRDRTGLRRWKSAGPAKFVDESLQ